MREEWTGFSNGAWTSEVNVRDFIQKNYTPYDGGEEFLAGPTERTKKVLDTFEALLKKERENGGVFITLEVRTSNLPAIAMYRSLGFTEAGVRRNFYTEPREDALIFTLSF